MVKLIHSEILEQLVNQDVLKTENFYYSLKLLVFKNINSNPFRYNGNEGHFAPHGNFFSLR